jgi:hypothetical protein
MKKLRIAFVNFWFDFDNENNIFLWLLKKEYDVIIDYVNPDYVFTGKKEETLYPGSKKILFCGEPLLDKGSCDIGLMQYEIDKPGFYRFPLYLYYIYDFIKKGEIPNFNWYLNGRHYDKFEIKQKRFCTWVCGGSPSDQYRDYFFNLLNKYKKIDCPGTRYNNMSKLPGDSSNGLLASFYKRNFIKSYKFTIGFENNSTKEGYNGYTTEKLIEPMTSNSLLIYWGNVNINNEFNNKSFLNHHDFESVDKFIEKIIEVDNDDNLYYEYMTQPYSLRNDYLNIDFLVDIMRKIID